MQGQLHVTCLSWCDFDVWMLLGMPLCPSTSPLYILITVEWISIGRDIWNAKVYPKLVEFYIKHMLPEMASPRYSFGQPN